FAMTRPPPLSTLLPYTTLFRSFDALAGVAQHNALPPRPALVQYRHQPFAHGCARVLIVGIAGIVDRRPVAEREKLIGLLKYDGPDRKSTRLNSSHVKISYAVFC